MVNDGVDGRHNVERFSASAIYGLIRDGVLMMSAECVCPDKICVVLTAVTRDA